MYILLSKILTIYLFLEGITNNSVLLTKYLLLNIPPCLQIDDKAAQSQLKLLLLHKFLTASAILIYLIILLSIISNK